MPVSTRLLTLVALSAITTTALHAQSTAVPTISPTVGVYASNGGNAVITFENVWVSSVKSPRDVASGQATGKRMHKPINAKAAAGWLDAGTLRDIMGPSSPTPEPNSAFDAFLEISNVVGSRCVVKTALAMRAGTSRLEVRIGDVARFFDADGKARSDLCER